MGSRSSEGAATGTPYPERLAVRVRTRVVQVCMFLIGGTGAACSFLEPEKSLIIRTDEAEYVLQEEAGRYSVSVGVHLKNTLKETVYLHRECGTGDNPSVGIERTDSDATAIRVDKAVCTSTPRRNPIPLPPEGTYRDSVRLVSSKPASGRFRLIYGVQRTDRVEGWGPVDLMEPGGTRSNRFTIRSPAEPGARAAR